MFFKLSLFHGSSIIDESMSIKKNSSVTSNGIEVFWFVSFVDCDNWVPTLIQMLTDMIIFFNCKSNFMVKKKNSY